MLANTKRIYALADYSVERRPKGWFYGRQHQPKGEFKGPYSSIASAVLMIARQLRKEIERRDKPFNLDL